MADGNFFAGVVRGSDSLDVTKVLEKNRRTEFDLSHFVRTIDDPSSVQCSVLSVLPINTSATLCYASGEQGVGLMEW